MSLWNTLGRKVCCGYRFADDCCMHEITSPRTNRLVLIADVRTRGLRPYEICPLVEACAPDDLLFLAKGRDALKIPQAYPGALIAVSPDQLRDRLGDRPLAGANRLLVVAPSAESLADLLDIPTHHERVKLFSPHTPRPFERMLTSTSVPRAKVRAHHQAGGREVR